MNINLKIAMLIGFILVGLLVLGIALYKERTGKGKPNYRAFFNMGAAWLLVGFVAFSLLHIGMFSAFRFAVWAGTGETYWFGHIGWFLIYEMRKDLITYSGIVACLYSYEFILNRLQGEARFLATEA